MGRLSTLTILLALGSWGSATDGAPYQDPASSPASQPRPPLPQGVQPGQYVKAVIALYQKGDNQKAIAYARAAAMYRDMLSPEDSATLDKYQSMIDQVQPAGATAEPPGANLPQGGPDANQAQPPTRGGTTDSKQKGRWLLQAAREQIRLSNFDEAEAKVAEADSFQIKWGLFDDTPTKVRESLAKAKAAAPPTTPTASPSTPAVKGDKKAAKTKLKEARTLLAAGQYDQAEAIATEVNAWNLNYGMFDDTPVKIVAASRAVRQRDAIRKIGPKGQPSQEIYDLQVQEARAALSAGKLDEAEARARMAQKMSVVPALTADRAEAVLHDIAMARARGVNPAVAANGAPTAPIEAPSAVVEREANALLNRGQDQEAATKFAESQRLQTRESSSADPFVVQSQAPGGDPFSAPPVAAAAAPAPDQAPAPAPTPTPAPASEPAAMPAAGNGNADPAPAGPSKLDQAKALLAAGNFADARTIAQQAKAEGGDLGGADEMIAQIGLAEQAGSLKMYEASLDSLRKGDNAHARNLLTQLSTADLDEATMQKVQDLLARLPKDGAGKANVGLAVDDAASVNAQRMNAEVGTRVGEARRLMETDPEKAIDLLNKTLVSIKAAGLSDPVARTMTRRVEVAIELAKKDKVGFDQKMKEKEFRADIERKRLRILLADKAKKERIKSIMEKAQTAFADGKYDEAESLAKTAGEIDPMDVGPVALATVARYKRRYETDLAIRADKEDGVVRAFQGVDRSGIIPSEMNDKGIKYDKGFKDLSESRLRAYNDRMSPKKDAKTMQYEAKLNETVSVNFKKQSLSEAVNFLSSYTGMNIVLDPTALAEAGLVDTSPVDLTVKDIKLRNALKLMLRPLGLTYKVENEVLLITSPQVNRSDLITRYHYVGDLVLAPKTTTNPTASPMTAITSTDPNILRAQATAAAASGNPMAANAQGISTSGNGERPGVGEQDFAPLVSLIKNTIAPNTWKGEGSGERSMGYGNGAGFAGGAGDDAPDQAIGSITPFFLNISLIIRHTPEVHDEIVDLLRQLRRLQDLQVSIEVRFITVSDSFFEQIGIDFDFAIESNTVGKKTSFAQYLPGAGNLFNGNTATNNNTTTTTTTTSPYVAVNPVLDGSLGSKVTTVGLSSGGNPQLTGRQSSNLSIPFTQSSGDLIAPFNTTPGSGATFGIAFLSDLEVYLFITAAQGDTRSNLVQAPKVTTFNGAAATINSANIITYVSQLIPIVGAGSIAFQPIPSQINDGVNLQVTPVVSADRRYVRMSLAPNFNTFTGFTTLSVPAAVGGGGLGGTGTSVNGTIQLPNFTQNLVVTTVTVPDGGTVLLGGVKRLREERVEFGVPILSKTPLINRLFRNIGIGRTTDSLMLMVTPRIIILEEEEERLGIPAVPTQP